MSDDDLEECWAEILPTKRQSLGPVELPANRSTVWCVFHFHGIPVTDRIEVDIPRVENKELKFLFDFEVKTDTQIDELVVYLSRDGGPPINRCSFNGRQVVGLRAGDAFSMTLRMQASEALMLLLNRAILIVDS